MRIVEYNRESAVEYAHKWALGRNPRFYDFENIGGDCTNFASQVIYAGAGVMNHTPVFGWYYYDLHNRAPAWTGVEYLYRFLVNNQGVGPVAERSDIDGIAPGDIIQLSFEGGVFAHSPVVVSIGEPRTPDTILLAAHSRDVDNFPLSGYTYEQSRFLHITHVNKI